VVLEAGHCPHDEVPALVNAALLEWMAGLPRAAAEPPAAALEPVAASGRTGA
jgi:hypothetical protein